MPWSPVKSKDPGRRPLVSSLRSESFTSSLPMRLENMIAAKCQEQSVKRLSLFALGAPLFALSALLFAQKAARLQKRNCDLHHSCVRLVDGATCIDNAKSVWLGARNFQISIAHPIMEFSVLDIDSVCSFFFHTPPSTHCRFRDRQVKQQGQIRLQPTSCQINYLLNQFRIESASGALVSHGCISISIGQNDLIRCQSRRQMLANVLSAIGGENQEFRQRIDLLLPIQQCRAQFLPKWRAARFARCHHLHATNP